MKSKLITKISFATASLVLLGLVAASCTKSGNPVEHTGVTGAIAKLLGGDASQPKVQYVPDMADAPTMKPQENYVEPPEGSVATNAVLYPKTVEEAEKTLKNPLPNDPQIVALGEKTYNTFCTPCHGAAAKGDGSITDVYPMPPDLTTEAYQKREDGFFFYRITFGANIMPGYGHATMPHERWATVHYLRKLQGVSK
jgi:mono/diheme cytochrome c family protein